jgi:hypothetical protein
MRQFPLLSTPSKEFFAGIFQLATDAVAGDCGRARSIAPNEGPSTPAENIFLGAGVTVAVTPQPAIPDSTRP